jgi:hypothetical protein
VEEGGGYLIFDIALASIWRMRSLQSTTTTTTTTTTTLTRRIKKKANLTGRKVRCQQKATNKKKKEAKP